MTKNVLPHRIGIAVAGVLLVSPVFADEHPESAMAGEISIEFWSDTVLSADSDESEFTNTYATIEPAFSVALTPRLALNVGLLFEEVDPEDGGSGEPGDDRFIEDHGLYVQQLFFEWSGDVWSARAGKLNPAFGVAWDIAPGLYGVDFAGDYELTDQWGAGVTIPFGGDEEGSVSLSIDAFMADTSGLSSCVITKCVRTRRADGGAGNTSGPESFSVTLGADALPALGGLGFQAGLLRRAGGEGDPEDELGFALAVAHAVELDGASVEWMFEAARLNSFEGGTDDVTYFTTGLTYLHGPWNVAVAGAMRSTAPEEGADVDDTLFQLSAGYAFESGLSIDVGWRYAEEEDETTRTLGTLIAYGFEF